MQDKFYLELPLKKEYFTTVRLTAGGICSMLGFNIDEIEDFKLCISEACLMLMRKDYCKAYVEFELNEGISAIITGGDCKNINNMSDETGENFSVSLLKELVNEVEFVKQKDILKQIKIVLKK